MFSDKFIRMIDQEKRIAIPPQFLEELGGIGAKIIITQSSDKCLYFFSLHELKKMHFLPLDELKKVMEKLKRNTLPEIVQIKSPGKILISGGLKKYAGLKNEVVLAGCNNYIEIWDKEKWDNKEEERNKIRVAVSNGKKF